MNYRITPDPAKFEIHAYGQVYDVSNSIKNWKEIEVVLKRHGLSGVFHEVSFPFEFVLDSYDIIRELFEKYKHRSVANMYVYIRNNMWPYGEHYHEPTIFNLDFTSYKKSDTIITVDTNRITLPELLHTRKKVIYDIPVSGIKEDKSWNFERIDLENSITLLVDSPGDDSSAVSAYNKTVELMTVGITYETAEAAVKDILYTNTVPYSKRYDPEKWHTDDDVHFTELNRKVERRDVKVDIELSGEIVYEMVAEDIEQTLLHRVTAILTKEYDVEHKIKDDDEDPFPFALAWKDLKNAGWAEDGEVIATLDWKEELQIDMRKDDRLYLIFRYEFGPVVSVFLPKINGSIKLHYNGRMQPVDVDLVKPSVLLQDLIDRITETKGKYHSSIEGFNENPQDLIMLMAAESIRGIEPSEKEEGAKIHTSFIQFSDWMDTLGYEQHYMDNSIVFRKRIMGFRTDLTAATISRKECADLRESVFEDVLYSGLEVGYRKKEYNNPNGRYEFNGTHFYSTDLMIQDRVVKFVSPYRADCYGIEFLAQERNQDTKDNKSDKDIFLVNVREEEETYETLKNTYSGNCPKSIKGLNTDSLFNGKLTPYHLMKMNEDLLGVSVNKMFFASSDCNSEIIIDNTPVNSDYDISKGAALFDTIIYNIASRNTVELPTGDNMNGLVKFEYDNKIHEGFIYEISRNAAWELETTWVLIKKRD